MKENDIEHHRTLRTDVLGFYDENSDFFKNLIMSEERITGSFWETKIQLKKNESLVVFSPLTFTALITHCQRIIIIENFNYIGTKMME